MHRLNRGVTTDIRHILYDVAGNVAVFLLCHELFYLLGNIHISMWGTSQTAFFFLFFFILLSKEFKLYDTTTFYYPDRVFRRTSSASFISMGMAVAILFFAGRAQTNRLFYLTYFLTSYAVFMVINYISYKQNRNTAMDMRTLMIGAREDFTTMLKQLKKTNLPVSIVGYVNYRHDDPDEEPGRYLGFIEDGDLTEVLKKCPVDQVYLMQKEDVAEYLAQSLELCINIGMVTHVVVQPLQRHCASYVSNIGKYPVLTYHIVSLDPLQQMMKRLMDVVGSFIGLVFFTPLLMVMAVLIKLDSPGPVFFRQIRVGRNGREFTMYKLRSMGNDAESRKKELEKQNQMKDGYMFKIPEDPRVTRIGKFLRKSSIDELPQLFNVLRGDMSLVGTRPPTKNEVEKYKAHHWRRLRIKPGITGLWQTQGRNEITDFEDVVALDIQYIQNWGLLLDVKLLLKTVVALVNRKGAY